MDSPYIRRVKARAGLSHARMAGSRADKLMTEALERAGDVEKLVTALRDMRDRVAKMDLRTKHE